MEGLEKVKEFSEENFELKDYFNNMNLAEARNFFKYRAKMTQYVKRNFKNERKYRQSLWQCISCKSAIDTQSHVMWCEAYREIRKNVNFENNKDLAKYIGDVLKIREKLEANM